MKNVAPLRFLGSWFTSRIGWFHQGQQSPVQPSELSPSIVQTRNASSLPVEDENVKSSVGAKVPSPRNKLTKDRPRKYIDVVARAREEGVSEEIIEKICFPLGRQEIRLQSSDACTAVPQEHPRSSAEYYMQPLRNSLNGQASFPPPNQGMNRASVSHAQPNATPVLPAIKQQNWDKFGQSLQNDLENIFERGRAHPVDPAATPGAREGFNIPVCTGDSLAPEDCKLFFNPMLSRLAKKSTLTPKESGLILDNPALGKLAAKRRLRLAPLPAEEPQDPYAALRLAPLAHEDPYAAVRLALAGNSSSPVVTGSPSSSASSRTRAHRGADERTIDGTNIPDALASRVSPDPPSSEVREVDCSPIDITGLGSGKYDPKGKGSVHPALPELRSLNEKYIEQLSEMERRELTKCHLPARQHSSGVPNDPHLNQAGKPPLRLERRPRDPNLDQAGKPLLWLYRTLQDPNLSKRQAPTDFTVKAASGPPLPSPSPTDSSPPNSLFSRKFSSTSMSTMSTMSSASGAAKPRGSRMSSGDSVGEPWYVAYNRTLYSTNGAVKPTDSVTNFADAVRKLETERMGCGQKLCVTNPDEVCSLQKLPRTKILGKGGRETFFARVQPGQEKNAAEIIFEYKGRDGYVGKNFFLDRDELNTALHNRMAAGSNNEVQDWLPETLGPILSAPDENITFEVKDEKVDRIYSNTINTFVRLERRAKGKNLSSRREPLPRWPPGGTNLSRSTIR